MASNNRQNPGIKPRKVMLFRVRKEQASRQEQRKNQEEPNHQKQQRKQEPMMFTLLRANKQQRQELMLEKKQPQTEHAQETKEISAKLDRCDTTLDLLSSVALLRIESEKMLSRVASPILSRVESHEDIELTDTEVDVQDNVANVKGKRKLNDSGMYNLHYCFAIIY